MSQILLSDERRSRSKIILLFNMDKRTLRSKIEGLASTKIHGSCGDRLSCEGGNGSGRSSVAD